MEMAGTPAAQDFVQLLLLKRALQNAGARNAQPLCTYETGDCIAERA
jgi:hypothetical protein